MKKINVQIRRVVDNTYDIEVGYDLFNTLIADLKGSLVENVYRYAIITDDTVKALYGDKLLTLMRENGFEVQLFSMPAGEKSKRRETKARIEDKMLEAGYRKDSCIIGLGGGVVTDLAGFLAATFCRGIPVINYATTFLAAADASIGGKTAVDTPLATNMIGLIVQPRKVYIDLKTWETLDDEQIKNGLAETIKHACLADYDFFEYLEKNLDVILGRDNTQPEYLETLEYVCEKNACIKYNVVSQDEQESNMREILNLGHTVGRAIEAASGFELLHGNAVSIGMAAQVMMACDRGYMTKEERDRVLRLLERAGLPLVVPKGIAKETIVEKLYADKKVRRGEIKFVFQSGIGAMKVFEDGKYSCKVPESEIVKVVEKLMV